MLIWENNPLLKEIDFSKELPFENVENSILEPLDFKLFWGLSNRPL